MEKINLAVLPGDNPGREMTCYAAQILEYILQSCQLEYEIRYGEIGVSAFENTGSPLPGKTVEICRTSRAVLVGFVGSHQNYADLPFNMRPEAGLLNLRKKLGIFANIKRVKVEPQVFDLSPLKMEILERGIDIAVVRELTGGIYYGKKGRCEVEGETAAYDQEIYTENEIERVVRRAFTLAQTRKKSVVCADKANLLETSQLWRKIGAKVAAEYPDVMFSCMYIDDLSADIIRHPYRYDVVVANNMFGDILSDEISVFSGAKSLIPTASFGQGNFGMYSPVAASFIDGTTKTSATMASSILAVALMLRFPLSMPQQAGMLEQAVYQVLDTMRTQDIASPGKEIVSDETLFHAIFEKLKATMDRNNF